MNTKHPAPPTFVGIGGMKCGTTWLAECLRYHPEIFMSTVKAIFFFGSEANGDKGAEWYLEHFRGSEGYKAVGEFSTSYLQKPTAAEQIRNTLGPVKILVMLRNPTERFLSHYKHLIRKGRLLQEEYSILNMDTFHQAVSLHPLLITHGNYSRNLQRFIDAFGAENICIIIKEDADKNPKTELKKVYSFLGVDPEYTPPILNTRVNQGFVPRFPSLEVLRLRLFDTLNKKAPRLIVYSHKLRLGETYRRLLADKRPERFKVEDEVIEQLYSDYRDEVRNIERFLGRNLDGWKR